MQDLPTLQEEGCSQPPERPSDATSPLEQDVKERAAAKRAAFIEREKASLEREKRRLEEAASSSVSVDRALEPGERGLGWHTPTNLPMILPTKFLSLPLPWVQDDQADCAVQRHGNCPEHLTVGATDKFEQSCQLRELEKLKQILERVGRGQSLEIVSEEELCCLRQSVAHIEWASSVLSPQKYWLNVKFHLP